MKTYIALLSLMLFFSCSQESKTIEKLPGMQPNKNTIVQSKVWLYQFPLLMSYPMANVAVDTFTKKTNNLGIENNVIWFVGEVKDGSVFSLQVRADEFLINKELHDNLVQMPMSHGNTALAFKDGKLKTFSASHLIERLQVPLDTMLLALKANRMSDRDIVEFTSKITDVPGRVNFKKMGSYPDSLKIIIKGVRVKKENYEQVLKFEVSGMAYNVTRDSVLNSQTPDHVRKRTQYILRIDPKYWDDIPGLSGSGVYLQGEETSLIGIQSMLERVATQEEGKDPIKILGMILEMF